MLHNRHAKAKKYGPNERTDQSSRKNKTKQQRDSQPFKCRVQNTGNQDAHRNDWVEPQNKGRSEDYTKWNKEKHTGNQSEGKKTETQTNGLEQKEEINTQPEQNEEMRIQKYEERLRNLQDNFRCSNIWIVGLPGEEEEQEIKSLFENIMKENFPNLAKEIDFQEVQEAQRVPKELGPKEAHQGTS